MQALQQAESDGALPHAQSHVQGDEASDFKTVHGVTLQITSEAASDIFQIITEFYFLHGIAAALV